MLGRQLGGRGGGVRDRRKEEGRGLREWRGLQQNIK